MKSKCSRSLSKLDHQKNTKQENTSDIRNLDLA